VLLDEPEERGLPRLPWPVHPRADKDVVHGVEHRQMRDRRAHLVRNGFSGTIVRSEVNWVPQ